MPLTRAQAAAEAPPSLLDALARAPAAAALVVAALDLLDDRKALRLAHSQLRDAVDESTTKLRFDLHSPGPARPPTARRWPRLEELDVRWPDAADIGALGSETWRALRTLRLGDSRSMRALDACAVRALAAVLPRMPALRELVTWSMPTSDAPELFCASSAAATPQLRSLTVHHGDLVPATARALAATGWRLEELDLRGNAALGGAGLAALAAAPTFAIRRLALIRCKLDAADLLALANAPWPLEELDFSSNDLSGAAAGPALAALARHTGLRRLDMSVCSPSAAGFKALVEAAWPALTFLCTGGAAVEFDGPHALGAAAFAGFPALEWLDLSYVRLGLAGARLLASRRWARLQVLYVYNCALGDPGVAALARGEWPALERLVLLLNHLDRQPTLEDARRWAPALIELR